MTLWSHHFLYIPHDRSHMRTTEIELNLGAIIAPKKTNCTKKCTADARAKLFWVNHF